MDRRGLAVFRNSFLVLVAACVSVQSACQYPAATPPAPAAVSPMPAADPAPAMQRRVAHSPDQYGGPIVRHAVACAQYRHTNTEFGADAGRELLGNNAGKHVRIEARAPLEGHRSVFQGHGQPDLRQ